MLALLHELLGLVVSVLIVTKYFNSLQNYGYPN